MFIACWTLWSGSYALFLFYCIFTLTYDGGLSCNSSSESWLSGRNSRHICSKSRLNSLFILPRTEKHIGNRWPQEGTLSPLPREHVAAGDTVRDHHLLQDLRGACSSYATAFSLGSGPRTMLMNPYSWNTIISTLYVTEFKAREGKFVRATVMTWWMGSRSWHWTQRSGISHMAAKPYATTDCQSPRHELMT